MSKEKFGRRRIGLSAVSTAVALLMLVVGGMTTADGQDAPPARPEETQIKNVPIEELHKAQGRLLTRGKNALPTGELKVKTYRLEEVALPEPLELKDRGTKVRVDKATRLSVTLDAVVNGPHIIWIGDDAYTAVYSQKGQLTALLLGFAVSLENGAVISVERGTNVCDGHARSVLPEKLAVPRQLRRAPTDQESATNFIKSIRSIPATMALRGAPDVEIELATDVHWPPRNQGTILQIGSREFARDPDNRGSALVFSLTAEEFARVEDGATVKVKLGACSFGGVRFGPFNKGILDRG